MGRLKGIIALDIDGTITIERHHLDETVRDYLNNLIVEGWQIAFVTGRTLSFALPVLSQIEGPYYLGVQNGAALYRMPSQEMIFQHYIEKEALGELNAIFSQEIGGLLVESGGSNHDICYYRPSDFTEEELNYLHFRMDISPEKWEALASFNDLPIGAFAVGKYFATEQKAHEIADRIRTIPGMNYSVVVIKDPFRSDGYLAHVNQEGGSKGGIFDHIGEPLIAAGDDYNDLEMLKRAKVKVVMHNAATPLHVHADVLAPPAKEHGIIKGLQQAISFLK